MPKKSIMKKRREREATQTAPAVVQVETAKSTNDQPLPLP
jgi:hypothetical protein